MELLELQKMDTAIERLQHRRRNLPEQLELDALEEKLTDLDSKIAQKKGEALDAAAQQRRLDADIELVSEKIRSEEAKLYSGDVGSPRELAALQSEIEALKKRRTALEDSDLEVMAERESAEAALADLNEEAGKLGSLISEARSRKESAVREIAAELNETELARQRRLPKFDRELLDFYEDVRSAKGGVGVALLEQGACQGCHMRLPAQELANLKRTEGMARCVECGRILVVG
ncbi:MAG: zinc ribbon domain-containing protein [Actinomycetota bacterium]